MMVTHGRPSGRGSLGLKVCPNPQTKEGVANFIYILDEAKEQNPGKSTKIK